MLFAVTMVCSPGARPGATIVAMLQGESEPNAKSAPFIKLPAVSVGPGGATVRLNCWLKPLELAVTVTAPAVAPALTVTEACPVLSVFTVLAERVAGPETLNCTGTPTAVPLLAFNFTTNGAPKLALVIAV